MLDFDETALQAVREGRLLIDRYDAWLHSEFAPFVGQRVLEIGCGLGNLSQHLLNRQLLVAIDSSPLSVLAVQEKFGSHKNFRAFTMSITAPEVTALADDQIDTAISLNVFEHIERDDVALEHTWRILQPGGMLILIIPAHAFLYGEMDRSIGHYRRYTKESLRRQLEQAGFEIVRQKYFNLLGALGWLVNGRLLRRRVPPTGQLKLFNRLVPLIRVLEGTVSMPAGISLLSVSRKLGRVAQ